MKLVVSVALFAGGLVFGYLVYSSWAPPKLIGIPAAKEELTQTVSVYLTFIGVMLTAVTAILTALAIGIGVVAAYTFAGIKSEAKLIAETAAKDTAKDTAADTAKETAKETAEETATNIASEALSSVKITPIIEKLVSDYIQREQAWGGDQNPNEER